MMRARLALLAAVAALVTASAVLYAQTIESIQRHLAPDGWTNVAQMSAYGDSVTRSWFGSLLGRAEWDLTQHDECAEMESAADMLFSEVHWLLGNNAGMWGEYYSDVALANGDTTQVAAFDRDLYENPAMGLATLLHESAHHIGYTHSGTFNAYTAESCAELKPPEEEDEPNGGGEPTPVCEEKTRWVTKTKMVWVPKWEIEWRLEWDEVDEYGNVTHVKIGTRVDNGSWKEVTTLPELETYTECSN